MRTLLRAAALGMSVWSIGMGLHLLAGWPLDYTILQALMLACVAFGAVLLLRPRMKANQVAERLDRRFHLKEQITTALEVSRQGTAEGVAHHLVERAHYNAQKVHYNVRLRQRAPWVEVVALLALLLLGGGMYLQANLDSLNAAQRPPLPLPPLAPPGTLPQEFPELSPPGSTGQQNDQAGGGGAERGNGQPEPTAQNPQQSLETLADALRDQSVTRPAAEALDQGDTAGAAQSVREVADQSDQLSPQTRAELSDALRQAADEIGAYDPELAGNLRESADGLQQENGNGAARALDNLAGAIEQLGNGQQQGQAAQAEQSGAQQSPQDWEDQGGGQPNAGNAPPPSEQRELPTPPERLNVEGVPLELQGGDTASAPTDGSTEGTPDTDALSGSFEQRGNNPDDAPEEDVGEDPLSIPPDMRDVVQDYFTP